MARKVDLLLVATSGSLFLRPIGATARLASFEYTHRACCKPLASNQLRQLVAIHLRCPESRPIAPF